MNDLLVMKNISKDFSGVKALDNVSLSVRKGEIHALVGENGAGKTTLMNILSGNYPFGHYLGEFFFDGKICHFNSPKDSEKCGIAIVHQELSLVQSMSIADNLFLASEKGSRFFLDHSKTIKEAERLLKLVGLDDHPETLVEDIGAGKQQLVEIAKALGKNTSLLILDEPTSSLGQEHCQKLLNLMLELKTKGKTMIIISHKLNEIMKVSDRITVLRDGKNIETLDNTNKDTDEKRIISAMVGRDISNLYPCRHNTISEEIALKVEHYNVLSDRRKGSLSLQDISLNIHKGEVVGLYGLMASGRSKLAKSIFGKSNGFIAHGNIEIYGKRYDLNTPKQAIDAGIAYVAEDRIKTGLALERTINENMTLPGLKKITKNGILEKAKEKDVVRKNIEHFQIKTDSYDQEVKELSGGNQQKVLLSEWVYTDPKILILDEPTRGIDIGAKFEIYNIINEYVASGLSILMISSDMPEMFGMCDRIYVLSKGRIAGELNKEDFSADRIMTMIINGEKTS